MVFDLDYLQNQNIYYVDVGGLGRPSEAIQNLILMHKLIRIQIISGSTYLNIRHLAHCGFDP